MRLRALAAATEGLGGSQQLRWRLLAVALGVVVHPSPQVLTRLLHGKLRLPVQLLVRQRGVGCQIENIALSTRLDLVGQVPANNLAESLDHLENGAAAARAQVPRLDTGLVLAEVVEGDEVTVGKIDDVDVIANGSSVAGCVV